MVLGGTLGSVNLFMTYPLQTIRVRLALDLGRTTEERQFKNIRDCFKKIYQSDKFVGLYRGWFWSILGIFVYRGLYFGLFDAAKFLTFTDNNFLYNFLIAQATTLTAGILSYPLNTIQSRLMMQNCRPEKQYSNIRGWISHIWRHEGIKGFFKGQLVSLSSSIGSALVLTIYSSIKSG